ncbi:MAG: hypothetical protein M3R59_02550 [Verrucomicrobiota bacterium]|nr:hypothetical protein [Verrucomicrobiota bacterium]
MRRRAFLSSAVLIAFLISLALASAPNWHERVHAAQGEHECAATLLATGQCDHAMAAPFLPQPARAVNFSQPVLVPTDGVIIVSSVLEHAPPTQS